jgi:regulatory protein
MDRVYTVDEAKKKLEYFCAYQERCHDEVVRKLYNMKMIPVAVDTIVAHLIEHNFLNEERFARSFARGKHRIKGWGRLRIVRELKARGITQYNITAALKEIPDTEYVESFFALARRLTDNIKEGNVQKKRQKLYETLTRRGYESNLIYEFLSDEM